MKIDIYDSLSGNILETGL